MGTFVSIVFVILTIILLTGKGSFLVAGYNTATREEKEKHDKEAVSRQAGWMLLLVDAAVITITVLDYYDKMKDSYAIVAGVYIVSIVLGFMFFGNKKEEQ